MITSSVALVLTVLSFLLLFPMPLNTYAEGVVWLPEQAKVRARTEGFVARILVGLNTVVKRDQILIELDDPILKLKKNILRHQLDELDSKLKESWMVDRVKAQIIEEQMKSVKAELAEISERIDNLTLKSLSDGIFIVPHAEDLNDRFLHKGDLVGYVVNYPITTIRTVVTQDNIGLVRERTRNVQVRLAENIKQLYPAEILRQIPAASEMLPSPALGLTGGGRFLLIHRMKKVKRHLNRFFILNWYFRQARMSEILVNVFISVLIMAGSPWPCSGIDWGGSYF